MLGGLQRGFALALLLIFALLGVPIRSYVQPLIIMSAIPFGLIGAVWGHLFLGLDVSMMSMFGLVAVTGVVVNDSLILVDFIKRVRAVHAGVGRMARQAGGGPADRRAFETAGLALAVREAGVHRFRPILLTSLTTFLGLAPLLWSTSFDAAFMVPMAVSLGFGALCGTLIVTRDEANGGIDFAKITGLIADLLSWSAVDGGPPQEASTFRSVARRFRDGRLCLPETTSIVAPCDASTLWPT